MLSQLEDKKASIVAILYQLKKYNPQIGQYEKSIYTEDFDYSVKLSNGRIRIPEEILLDYENSPVFVSDEQMKLLSSRFIFSELPLPSPPLQQAVNEGAPERKRRLSTGQWIGVILLLLIFAMGFKGYQAEQEQEERDRKSAARNELNSQVVVEGSSYMVSLFGGISELKVTVTNNSRYLVDIVKVKVTYIKANGAVYKDEYLNFNNLAPYSSATQNAPESNRGKKVTISRESMTCSELDLFQDQ